MAGRTEGHVVGMGGGRACFKRARWMGCVSFVWISQVSLAFFMGLRCIGDCVVSVTGSNLRM